MADIAAVNWNEVDASNTAAAPDGAVENMMPSGVNNVLRAHQGAIKRMWKRNSVMLTGGTSTAFTVTHTVAPTALADGEIELLQFHSSNAAFPTLNVGGLGARPLRYFSAGGWRTLPAGLLGASQIMRVSYHSALGSYLLLDLPDRTGEVVPFAGHVLPAGTLLCLGQEIGRNEYAGLFATLSTAHGVGDGTNSFNLPDLRGRAVAGKGDMGGFESGRLNGQIASFLGAAGGQQDQIYGVGGSISGSGTISGTAFTDGMPTLGVSGGSPSQQANPGVGMDLAGNGHTHGINGNAGVGGTCTITSGSIVGGATDTRSNVQPTMELNYIIRI